MRILMLLFSTAGKGTYWRALHLARSLAKQGHKVTVLATSQSHHFTFRTAYDIQPGVTLVECPDLLWGSLRSGWDAYNVMARIGWLRTRHYDLVHAFEARPVSILPALYLRRWRKTRLILDWCDWFGSGGSVEERPNWLIRSLLRPVETFFEENFRTCAHGTTVINRFLRQKAIALGVRPETILDLPNGSNIRELRPLSQAEARRVLGWPVDVPIIGYLGAIFHRDALLMAQAFDRIRATQPKAQLLLAGYCNVAVERLVREPAAVLRTGRISYDAINHYLAACDICWLPLRNSGANQGRYPLKINDYMAVGKPVVVTKVGEVADLVRRGNFGLVAADNPAALAVQVLALIRDPEEREAMGRRARQLAESELTWDQIAERLEQFYRKITEATWE
jgi:glycosyltransferase involved in cell wall biosynthesis